MSENRVALITGANKGIGLQIAKDLASHGLTVLIGSRSTRTVKQRPRPSEKRLMPFNSM